MSMVFEVGGDSMAPALARGARVLVVPPGGEVRAGDVVVLRASEVSVLHRVVLTFEEDGHLWLLHRGDNGGRPAVAPVAAVVGQAVGSLEAGLATVPSPDDLAPRERRGFRRARWMARAYVVVRRIARVLSGGLWPRRSHPAVGLSAPPSGCSNSRHFSPAYNAPTLPEEGGRPTVHSRPHSRLRIAPGVAWRLLDGEAAVIDLERGRTVRLNRTASLVWSMLEGSDEPAIVDAVVARFEIDAETARADVRRLLLALREQGFLVEA